MPILIIIPHGGTAIPEELQGHEAIDSFRIFYESDACANDIFNFREKVVSVMNTHISRLFIDLDRHHFEIPPKYCDGAIKKESITGKSIYTESIFPDELALSNLLERYHLPFHETVEKIIFTGGIKFIIDCHTVMPVGPYNSADSGKPRPLLIINNKTESDDGINHTCTMEMAENFMESLKKFFSGEETTITARFAINNPPAGGYILKKYGLSSIPMLRLSVSRSLFLNDRYFNSDTLTVDALRLEEIRDRLWKGISRFYSKHF